VWTKRGSWPTWNALCGRRANPFNLRVSEIPVAGRELWQLDPGHVVVTAGLLGDPGEYRRRLTPILQALL